MPAETACNVIQALPEKEYTRLLQMLGVEPKPKPVKLKNGRSKAETREFLINRYFSKKRK